VCQVLVRGRVHTVRGKGKSAFLVLRQRTATVQVGRSSSRGEGRESRGDTWGHWDSSISSSNSRPAAAAAAA
jgi:hypothetical protein